jgi:16S rRNA (adenine(1408)-N(1))-methyltransferase
VLVIGIDPDRRAMAEASRHAARPERRGGLPNALFVAGAAQELPGPFAGRADLVTVALPWGSLLRALLVPETDTLASLAATLAPEGELELLLSADPHDGQARSVAAEADALELATCYVACGFELEESQAATAEDVAHMSSAWGRRLGIPARRAAWLIRLSPTSLPPLARVPRAP